MTTTTKSVPEADAWKLLEQRPLPSDRARIISISNQKGGVAKTTTAINLGAALALEGLRVLVVDVDSQANATTGLGLDHRSLERSTYDLLIEGTPLAEIAVPTSVDGLHCAPASLDLAGAEVELVAMTQRELRLSEALRDARGEYDFVFIDCPPSLGLLTLNALAAAEDLIVPVQCEYYALEGLGQLLGNAERVRRALNPGLRIAGFLLTMYDARTKLSSQVADDVRSHFGDLVLATVIPRTVRLSEAPSFGEPVVTLDPTSRGSIAYRLVARELIARYGLEQRVVKKRPENAPVPATPGPGGRGYGVVAPEPEGLDRAWPRTQPWIAAS
nr:ParA family protein [Actinomycetota bacterium]